MHLAFIQNFAYFLLLGFVTYSVFSTPISPKGTYHRSMLIGAALGACSFLFISHPSVLNDAAFPLDVDFSAGPLILAGYLGGPIAAIITSLVGLTAQIWGGRPSPLLAALTSASLPFLGVLVGYLRPYQQWADINARVILASIFGFLTVQLFFLILLGGLLGRLEMHWSLANGFALLGAGALSILATSIVIKYSKYWAEIVARSDTHTSRFELATESAGLGVFVVIADSDTLYFDGAAMAIFGLDRDGGDIKIEEWLSLVHPDDLETTKTTFNALWTDTLPSPEYAYRILRRDGATAFVRANWFVSRAKNGKVQKIIGVLTDVTDIQEAERKHSIAEARIAGIANNLPGVLMSFDFLENNDFRVTYISHQCEDIWGYTAQEIIDDHRILVNAHDPADLDDHLKAMEDAAKKLDGFTRRFKITDRIGAVKWLEARVTTSHKTDSIVSMDGLFIDITNGVEAQLRLTEQTQVAHRAQKHESIGQLTGGVAHDFNNLLAVVLGNMELLRDELTSEEQIELIDSGIAAIFQGANLTRNMLAFARKAQLDPKPIDLNKVVRDTKNWTARTLPATISVELSLLAGLWQVSADPSSTESAILNLILNARDAMEDVGELTIETANVRIDEEYIDSRDETLEPGRYVMLAVSDTGHGIADDKLASIFEPFFSTKAPGAGSGLGLSMIEGFMRQSGGTVQVYSEVGVGTTFKLYFPAFLGDDRSVEKPIIRSPETSGGSGKILVAEDEPEVLRVIVANLKKAGYSVTQASSGDQAKEIFEANPNFDLLLTDIVMPGTLQGTTLARVLRKEYPDLPVIFMSGYASEATVHGNGLRPEDIRLMKPVGRADLFAAIEKLLAARIRE
ncbi:PAS domain-containing protein [Lentibacter algarum]|uniref:PAS domain-containing protein n=1 Tax=Lentibacter algarum TaxID=576131 RepID=UPI001C0A5098|nr:PAS domain-containing protein [Lentibacter algarum]MBU2983276.1 PAS domain-containing protein [Lentibacter algarum]